MRSTDLFGRWVAVPSSNTPLFGSSLLEPRRYPLSAPLTHSERIPCSPHAVRPPPAPQPNVRDKCPERLEQRWDVHGSVGRGEVTVRTPRYSVELITLPVSDVERALRFYVDQVGFTLDVDYR